MTWTDDDRLREDEKGHDARLQRINAAVSAHAAALREAARTNRDGWPVYSDSERQQREESAWSDLNAALAEADEEYEHEVRELEQRLSDNTAPRGRLYAGVKTEELQRDRELRTAVRDEVANSTVDEIERQAGAALRGGDRQLARIWAQEINEHVKTLDGPAVGRLVSFAASLLEQALDPEQLKQHKALVRRLDARKRHWDAFREAAAPHRVAMNRRAMVASGQYGPL